MKLLMTLGLKDDLRETVASDVAYARDVANLNVRMVSNDMRETAEKVAQKAGILSKIPGELSKQENYEVMSGDDFKDQVGSIT